MNNPSPFFRLLTSPVPAKGDDLRQQIAATNQGQPAGEVFLSDLTDLTTIPGSPFAYWVGKQIKVLFTDLPPFEGENRTVKVGLQTGDDNRFVRLWWEVLPEKILDTTNSPTWNTDNKEFQDWCQKKVREGKTWILFAKGGAFSPYYSDIHLIVDWNRDGQEIASSPGSVIRNSNYYFRPGLTYSDRTSTRFAPRIMPQGVIISVKGSGAYSNDVDTLWNMLGIMNSQPFYNLMNMLVGTTSIAKSYQVGTIGRVPFPVVDNKSEITSLSKECFLVRRSRYVTDEPTHVFCLPSILHLSGQNLEHRLVGVKQVDTKYQQSIAYFQAQVDACVAELYGVEELAQTDTEQSWSNDEQITDNENFEDDDEAIENVVDPVSIVADFLMWCVGVALGRWDVRYALDPARLPELPGPFDPLPVCSPGMLSGADGLPMHKDELSADYPLPIAWDGFLVDDPDHPRDIVAAVERTLALVWPGDVDRLVKEACSILGVPDLRAWLRDPRGFFAYHTRRYSKSRRKAPIYWLLQSARRSYTIWLYYPRLDSNSLYRAGREYADAKLSLETGRLEDWQASLATATGSARKLHERKLAGQQAVVAELKAFVKTLDAAALLELKPDLNDGVLLNIAPLRELVPWKEAGRAWDELLRGKYAWSSIGKQLHAKGLVKKVK